MIRSTNLLKAVELFYGNLPDTMVSKGIETIEIIEII